MKYICFSFLLLVKLINGDLLSGIKHDVHSTFTNSMNSVSHLLKYPLQTLSKSEERISKSVETFVDKEAKDFTRVCFDELGCFDIGSPFFDPVVRPVSLLPEKPSTTYELYTPHNPDDYYDLKVNQESVDDSPFMPHLPTKVLIHGFLGNLLPDTTAITVDMRKVLLEQGDYNVIVIDWTKTSGLPYNQATSNTRTVAAEAANLLNLLIDHKGIQPESIHLIGHSLGSHIAGYIGDRIPNIGRITGLDPAGPGFYGKDPEVRLDPTDALFVDVIHTSGGTNILEGLGMLEPVGHMDFYPNGGAGQPACVLLPVSSELLSVVPEFLKHTCDHIRSMNLYIESITNKDCIFKATYCSSYSDYLAHKCSRNPLITEMGFFTRPINRLRHQLSSTLQLTMPHHFARKIKIIFANV